MSNYRAYTVTIPARGNFEIQRTAAFIAVLDAENSLTVSLDHGERSDVEAGLTIKSEAGFSHVSLGNPHDEPQTVKFGLGSGSVIDARNTITGTVSVAGLVEVNPSASNFYSFDPIKCKPNTENVIANGDELRREVIVTNDGDETVYILGNYAGQGGRGGLPLYPRQTASIATRDRLTAANRGTGTTDLFVNVITDGNAGLMF